MTAPPLVWIRSDDAPEAFPPIESALDTPDGLLAAGGDLSQDRLLFAYRHGIFPWYEDGQPILWWSPDPRCVIYPQRFHVSRRLKRDLRQSDFQVRINVAFADVISACAEDRADQRGTWITAEMMTAYQGLHNAGWAHSIEIWRSGALVGGVYGIAIDRIFFGESMFSRDTNASKAALLALCNILDANGFALLDCQVESAHLLSLGATLEPRRMFASILATACAKSTPFSDWPEKALNISDFPTK